MTNNQTVLFLHLPKCAGNSIYEAFKSEYGKFRVLIAYLNPERNAKTIKHKLNILNKWRYKAVCAHMPYGAHRFFNKATYSTLLRHPVDRVLSSYFYSKEKTFDAFGEKIRNGELSLKQFASSPGIENTMTRWLFPYNDFTIESINQHVLYRETSDIAEKYLKGAKRTIDECSFVGIFEEMEKSIKLLEKIYSWDERKTFPWKNQTLKRQKLSEIDADTYKYISEINKYDMELYEYAKCKFNDLYLQYDFKLDEQHSI